MKAIMVNEVYQLHGTASVSITEEASLGDVIYRFAHEPGIRGVFLVDEELRFAGIVSRIAIMKWAEFQLFGKHKGNIPASEITSLVDLTKARYLARGDWRSYGVKESDTLEEAFTKMMSFGEDIVPVLDEDGKIIGDLRLSEVLLKALEVGRQAKDGE